MTCAVDNCPRPMLARGFCNTHYARWRKHGAVEKAGETPIPDHIREIPGYAGYFCDASGAVYTTRRKGRHLESRGPLRPMVGRRRPDGYLQAHFRIDGAEHAPLVHQVVARTWIGEPSSPDLVVNHKNGQKSDNRVENLEWVTQAENLRHAREVLGRA